MDQDDRYDEWARGHNPIRQHPKDKARDLALLTIVGQYDDYVDKLDYLKAVANLTPTNMEFPDFVGPNPEQSQTRAGRASQATATV